MSSASSSATTVGSRSSTARRSRAGATSCRGARCAPRRRTAAHDRAGSSASSSGSSSWQRSCASRCATPSLPALHDSCAARGLPPRRGAELLERRVGRDHQAAAGETDHPVERQEKLRSGRRRRAASRREPVRPGGGPGSLDVPHRDHVVEAMEAMHEPVGEREPAGDVRPFHARLDDREHAVHLHVVRLLGDRSRSSIPSSRQVATSATGRSRLMCAFIPASANCSGATPFFARCVNKGSQAGGAPAGPVELVERGEEETREPHVEPFQETAVRERVPAELRADAFRHLAVEAGEAGDAVGARGRRLEARAAARSLREPSTADAGSRSHTVRRREPARSS